MNTLEMAVELAKTAIQSAILQPPKVAPANSKEEAADFAAVCCAFIRRAQEELSQIQT